jgi:ATP-binding cassette, subfamily B, bacterial
MPRQYSNGARVARGPATRAPGGASLPNTRSLRERVGALRHLWPFLAMVWRTSPQLTAASLLLRLLRALLPIVALYIGKLIIDDVVSLVQMPDKPETLQQWLRSGELNRLGVLLSAEFAVAVLTDVLGRVVSLVDSLLSERVSNASSIRLMEHAATLDLEDFEDAGFQDQLERARRQTSGRMALIAQLFGQAQDTVTVVSLAAGLVIYSPWLIVMLCSFHYDRHRWLLSGLCLCRMAHPGGAVHGRRSHFSRWLVPASAHFVRRTSGKLLKHGGAGALPRRSVLVLRGRAGNCVTR